MPIWCRRARFSSSRAARERKIEDRVARAVLRKMRIGAENCERSIIPLCSETSRFSRGTIRGALGALLGCLAALFNFRVDHPDCAKFEGILFLCLHVARVGQLSMVA